MNSFLVVALGVGVIILCSGVVRCATMYMKSRYGDGRGTPAQTNEFQLRLDEMDKRLHDILDVMIALSEKFDRWEAEPSRDPAVRS